MIKNRQEALAVGEKWYFTGKACKHGHTSRRQVSNKSCEVCAKIRFSDWESRNLAIRAEKKRIARAINPNKFAEISKKSRDNHKGENAVRCAKRYADKHAEYISNNMRRKAILLERVMPWSNFNEINLIYKEAREKSLKDGISYHVDHILPLRGKRVSGLHVHMNLQILVGTENISKGNRWQ